MADLRGQLHMHLNARIQSFGLDELRVLALIADRLYMGQNNYGKLDIKSDNRIWKRELYEELLDAAVYDAIGRLADEK